MAAGFFSWLFSRGAVSQQEVKHPNVVVRQQVGRSAFGSRECIKFLVCGLVGVGKSTLINSLVGRDACGVDLYDPNFKLSPASTALTEVRSQLSIFIMNSALVDSPGQQDRLVEGNASNLEHLNSIDLILIETPGLIDGEDDQCLEAMYQKCKDADLFLYCLDMTTCRFGSHILFKLFTKKFGPDIWKHCVLVMTKANCVFVPRLDLGHIKTKREYHRSLYNAKLETFREELGKLGVSGTIRDNIPACAVGLITPNFDDDDRKIWYVSDKVKPELEEEALEFLAEFWRMCLERVENVQKLKKKDQQVEEVTRKLESELTSLHYQEKRELEQRIKDWELKLTSAQQEKEKMVAKHEQEKRELELKHKEILKKKDEEKIEMEKELEQRIKNQEQKLTSAQEEEKELLAKHEQEKKEMKDQEKIEMEQLHLEQVEDVKRKHNSELASAQQKSNQEKRELEQRIEDQELKLTSAQQEKEKMEELLAKHEQERRELESKHTEMLKKKDEEKVQLESELSQYKGLPTKEKEISSRNQNPPTLMGILELRNHGADVIRDIGKKYEDFGVFLLDDPNGTRVDALKEQYKGDCEEINRQIIKEWLKGGKNPVTWEALGTALKKTGLVELAKHLNKTLTLMKYL